MKINQFIKSYAEEINGNFSEYDNFRSVIVVPLDMDRQQAVVGEFDSEENIITISSKVCIVDDRIRFKELLGENHKSIFSRFTIANDFLKVESKILMNEVSEKTLKNIIQEVAKLADKWELNITGRDIF